MDATDGADAVSGTGGMVRMLSVAPVVMSVPPGMSLAPRRCLGCQASNLFSWAARQRGGGEMQKYFFTSLSFVNAPRFTTG